ncbi:thioesterase domain-containing protein [uncultured Aquimarina sp.]|uniref:thioesterase II family protein n=1 Tax=uncultured Aquimarina sp. TaxID=575652 RepID=UPI0026170824|nr:thioesterase domain-containing protein [uncultured Aquimarina sp.]
MKKPQLFLLHFAGGNCYSYQFMIPFIDEFIVIPLELPGRGNRINESLKRDLNSAAEDICNQILKKLNGSHFMIYGHSLGAILALKVTSMLEGLNRYPSYLFASGDEGPSVNEEKKRYLLDDEGLIQELIKFGGISTEIIESKEFLDYYLPILRADFEIAGKITNSYSVINTPIFSMMGDMEEDVGEISNWEKFTKSFFEYKIFKGGHFFIYDYPEEIVEIISKSYHKSILSYKNE